ncbi:hypothetical protein N9Y55_03005, partial [bacterium]|nr:hypothetical protein [bacterium]
MMGPVKIVIPIIDSRLDLLIGAGSKMEFPRQAAAITRISKQEFRQPASADRSVDSALCADTVLSKNWPDSACKLATGKRHWTSS